jgi:glycosyltransferase involved in cell wall biosynthesis
MSASVAPNSAVAANGIDLSAPPRTAPIAIGLPVYNGAEYLSAALESILRQTVSDIVVTISDNGSTDDTPEICQRFAARDSRVRWFREAENRGAAWNFNRVFELSLPFRRPYFKWMAHDDLHDPHYLARCLAVLEENPSVVLCYATTKFINGDGSFWQGPLWRDELTLRDPQPERRFRRLLALSPMHALFGVVRTAALARTGGWGRYASADRVLVGELVLHGQIVELPEPLFLRRLHPGVSWVKGMRESDYAVWYDPRNKGRIAIPQLQRAVGYGRAVGRAPLSGSERAKCYFEIVRNIAWSKRTARHAKRIATSLIAPFTGK